MIQFAKFYYPDVPPYILIFHRHFITLQIQDAPALKRMTRKVELMNPAVEAKETSGTYLSM